MVLNECSTYLKEKATWRRKIIEQTKYETYIANDSVYCGCHRDSHSGQQQDVRRKYGIILKEGNFLFVIRCDENKLTSLGSAFNECYYGS